MSEDIRQYVREHFGEDCVAVDATDVLTGLKENHTLAAACAGVLVFRPKVAPRPRPRRIYLED